MRCVCVYSMSFRKKVNELQQEEETKRMKLFQVSYMMEMSGDC